MVTVQDWMTGGSSDSDLHQDDSPSDHQGAAVSRPDCSDTSCVTVFHENKSEAIFLKF